MTPRHLDLVHARPELADLDPADRRSAIRSLLSESNVPDASAAASALSDFIDAFGPLTSFMDDERVTDVLVNGPDEVWIERDGLLTSTPVVFADAAELTALLRLLMGKAGRSVDLARPIADARLSNGSRMHVVLPPVAPRGPIVSIRRFPERVLTLDDLAGAGMVDSSGIKRLTELVRGRMNIVIAGQTGAGKTTLLNALLRCIPSVERIVTIEETPELRRDEAHVVSLLARAANVEGAGEVTLEDLLRAALRMRPDRIIVGEVRGAEALVALSALSTGHEGSMVTVHARSAGDVPRRLVGLALHSRGAPSERSLYEQVRGAFDAVVFLERTAQGRRVVASIQSME